MLRRLQPLLCSGKPVLAVLDGHNVQVVPNVLSVTIETCELRSSEADTLPLLRLETRGIGGRELVLLRARDLMRPRDNTMVLGLLESVYKMVQSGALLDESVEIPLETSRTQQRMPTRRVGVDGFDHLHSEAPTPVPPSSQDIDLWLSFYAHPQHEGNLFCLFMHKDTHALRHAFQTPLRATNLMFKHNNWNCLSPAAYRELSEAMLPTAAQMESSVICTDSAETLLLPLPGVDITIQDGRVALRIPKTETAQRTLQMVEAACAEGAGDRGITLLASRHAPGINGFLCWDPRRELDSFVISAGADEVNINEVAAEQAGAQRQLRIGATFVTLGAQGGSDEPRLAMSEDGVAYRGSDVEGIRAALFAQQPIDTEGFSLEWVDASDVAEPADAVFHSDEVLDAESGEGPTMEELEEQILGGQAGGDAADAEPMDDWLGYIKSRLAQQASEKDTRRSSLSRAVPELTHVSTTVRSLEDAERPAQAQPDAAAQQQEQKQGPASYKTQHRPVQPEGAQVEEVAPPSEPGADGGSAEADLEERTTVEPRMTKADFGDMQEDKRAQDEAWEPYVIRLATVLSVVFAHCGKRIRPTKGKEEPGSVTVEVVPNAAGSVDLKAHVHPECGIELIPKGIEILEERLNKHCRQVPHVMPVRVTFSV